MIALNKLSENHWTMREYRQRVTTKQWKEILLEYRDKITFQGRVYQLVGKRIGPGVWEIQKNMEES